MSHPRNSTWRIFAVPFAIGVASVIGLILGLTGDGLRDTFAWLLVGLAPFTILAALMRRTSDNIRS